MVSPHRRRLPRRPVLRSSGTARPFGDVIAEAWDRAERGEKTERERLREAALAQDPSGDLARRLDAYAAGANDVSIKELRAVLEAGRGTTEGSEAT